MHLLVCTCNVSVCIFTCINYSYTTTARLHFISHVKQCQVTSVHGERTQKGLCISIKTIGVMWEDIHDNFCLIHIGYNTRGKVMA